MEDSSQAGIHALIKVALGHMMLELILVMTLMVILVMAALYDYRERRIPNLLAFSGWLIGPLLHFVASGGIGLKISVLGLLIMFLLTFPLWLLRSIGAGDVKLMATVGALVGSGKALYVLLTIAVAGLVYALGIVLYRVSIDKIGKTHATGDTFGNETEAIPPHLSALARKKEKIPYAIPIAFGTLIALLLIYK